MIPISPDGFFTIRWQAFCCKAPHHLSTGWLGIIPQPLWKSGRTWRCCSHGNETCTAITMNVPLQAARDSAAAATGNHDAFFTRTS